MLPSTELGVGIIYVFVQVVVKNGLDPFISKGKVDHRMSFIGGKLNGSIRKH